MAVEVQNGFVVISTAYELPPFGATFSEAGAVGQRGPFPDSYTACTKLYVPLIQVADRTVMGMLSSDDEGETWSLEDTEDVGTDNIQNISSVVDGTLIRCVVATYDAAGDDLYAIQYHEYNMATDLWQDNANIPTGTIVSSAIWTTDMYSSETSVGIHVVNGFVIIHYTLDRTHAYYARIATDGTSWTTDQVISATKANSLWAIPSVGDTTKLHVNVYSGTPDVSTTRSLDTTDWSWTTAIDIMTDGSTDPSPLAGDGRTAYLGHDGTGDLFGFMGMYGGAWWVILVYEDGNGDLTLTGKSQVEVTVGNYDSDTAGGLEADPETGYTGDLYLMAGNSPYEADLWQSTDWGDNWDSGTALGSSDVPPYNGYPTTHRAITFATSLDRVIPILQGESTYDPKYRYILLEIGAIVESEIRPVEDTAGVGWDSAPTASQDLWAQLDEVTPSDTDYIFAEDPNP